MLPVIFTEKRFAHSWVYSQKISRHLRHYTNSTKQYGQHFPLLTRIPHALQSVTSFPHFTPFRHIGVFVLPQFWHLDLNSRPWNQNSWTKSSQNQYSNLLLGCSAIFHFVSFFIRILECHHRFYLLLLFGPVQVHKVSSSISIVSGRVRDDF